MEWLSNPETYNWLLTAPGWISLISLTVMEIVLGIDNLIFIAVLSSRLPKSQQAKGQRLGVTLALVPRLVLLASMAFLASLNTPVIDFTVLGHHIALSGKGLMFLFGGLFLIYSATHEIHERIEGDSHGTKDAILKTLTWSSFLIQILVLNLVFSLDSIITAVGMVDTEAPSGFPIVTVSIFLSAAVMLFAAQPVSDFVNRHPTVRMLAFSFLLLIGTTLVAEAFHVEIEKGYIYAAMGFSAFVEFLNLLSRRKKTNTH